MIEHRKCRPPHGVKVIRAIDDGKLHRRDTGQPMHAFLTEDPQDPTALIIWIADCTCRGEPACPRVKAFSTASRLPYDSTSVRSDADSWHYIETAFHGDKVFTLRMPTNERGKTETVVKRPIRTRSKHRR